MTQDDVYAEPVLARGKYAETIDSRFSEPAGISVEPSSKTLKVLFAQSRNRCAFPLCDSPIVEHDAETVTGEICHIKARNERGARFDPLQTEEERHAAANLLLLCSRHHKIVDDNPVRYSADALYSMKSKHVGAGIVEISSGDSAKALLLLESYRRHYSIQAGGHVMVESPGGIQAHNLTINNAKRRSTRIALPPGVLGSVPEQRSYAKHLIDRYREFGRIEKGESFRDAVIYAAVKREFGCDWQWIPTEAFDGLCDYLQQRIDRTRQGRLNRSKKISNYSSFKDFQERLKR